MEELKVKNMLEDWFNTIYSGDAGKGARKTYAKLKLRTESRTVSTPDNYYERARTALKERGDILEAEQDSRLLVAMGSGRNNMNPTIVEICFEEQQLRVQAWAKEGLIPQKSAILAVEACLEAMKLN